MLGGSHARCPSAGGGYCLEQIDTPKEPPPAGDERARRTNPPPAINWLDLSRVCPVLPDRIRARQTELYAPLTAPLRRRFVGSANIPNQHGYYFIFLSKGFSTKT